MNKHIDDIGKDDNLKKAKMIVADVIRGYKSEKMYGEAILRIINEIEKMRDK